MMFVNHEDTEFTEKFVLRVSVAHESNTFLRNHSNNDSIYRDV